MQASFGFLLFNQFEDMDLIGPYEMIGIWNKQFNGPDRIFTIGENNNIVKSVHGLAVQPDCDFDHCPGLDYLLVPGGQGTRLEVNNNTLISFIAEQAKNCKAILSVCTSAFLLQAAGLLHHKKATTHWASMDRLRAFTDVMVEDARFVRDGNIWTSAGISAGVDLALAFIADAAGDDVAGRVQLAAEYFPSSVIYGADTKNIPAYVR